MRAYPSDPCAVYFKHKHTLSRFNMTVARMEGRYYNFRGSRRSFTLYVLVDYILQPIQPLHDPDSVTSFVAF